MYSYSAVRITLTEPGSSIIKVKYKYNYLVIKVAGRYPNIAAIFYF